MNLISQIQVSSNLIQAPFLNGLQVLVYWGLSLFLFLGFSPDLYTGTIYIDVIHVKFLYSLIVTT